MKRLLMAVVAALAVLAAAPAPAGAHWKGICGFGLCFGFNPGCGKCGGCDPGPYGAYGPPTFYFMAPTHHDYMPPMLLPAFPGPFSY